MLNGRIRWLVIWSSLLFVTTGIGDFSPASAAEAQAVVYAAMPVEQARARVLDWVAGQGVSDKAKIEAVGLLWAVGQTETPRADQLHERVVRTLAIARADVEQLVAQCRFGSVSLPTSDLLTADRLDPFAKANLRASVGEFLAQSGFYDEALEVLGRVTPAELVDPASYFFFKAVCEQQLLKKTEGLATLKLLLEQTADVPPRYRSLAELMQTDLAKLEDKSLDEISRLMADVERRLGLGRSGEKVEEQEDEIVKKLEDLIKKLEEQAQKSQSQPQNGNMKPAEQSRIKGSTAPGEVDKKDIGHKAGWGALPPKQQAAARNLIDRELPPHYRNAIEQYLKKLANRPETPR